MIEQCGFLWALLSLVVLTAGACIVVFSATALAFAKLMPAEEGVVSILNAYTAKGVNPRQDPNPYRAPTT